MKNLASLVATTKPVWFKQWFDSSFYHQLYSHRNDQEAASFIDGLIGTLDPNAEAKMLDLGCGAGRHAKYLASKGFNVTGLDLAGSSIIRAKQYEMASLQFFQHDMRIAFGKNFFDYVFNFFTSFGYFETEAENDAVIHNIATSLKPGGTVVMDYLNSTVAAQNIVTNETKEIDGVRYDITRSMSETHFFKRIAIDYQHQQGPLVFTERVAKLSVEEFRSMFSKHGLQLQEVYGDYRLNTFEVDRSPRQIMVATKK
ncbi:MAG TPA: class I SAM-dependent methyltransferase [Chryseolinea sp.]|nr:class I SAM-dependent methyltransferase [Chryseolinea sp.]